MKKYAIFIVLLTFLTVLLLGNIVDSPPVSAQEKEHSAKINSLLGLQVESKLRALEAAPAERGRAQLSQAMPQQMVLFAPHDRQQIFIHSAEMFSQSQIEELESMGITVYPESWIPPVGSHPTGFIVADMPIDKLDELAAKDYIATLDTAEQFLEPHNDLAAQKINADDVWSGNYTGANVTIAVLDSGLDVNHIDIPTPVASQDYSYWPTLDDTISNNVTGHGTHVTGSALGRGTQSDGVYKGTAPGASLVFLKIGRDDTSSATTAAMVNAIKAAVDTYNADIITMSYGGWGQYHDGSSQIAQAVDYAVSQGAVVFISAGNDGDDDEHYSGTVSANSSTGFIQVNVTNASTNNTALLYNLVWYDDTGTSNDLELEYYDPVYNPLPSTNFAQSESSRGTESEWSVYDNVYVPAGNSIPYLKVKNNSSNSQFFHLYYSTAYNRAGAGSVKFNSPDPKYTIGSPADADSAIAVGAYTTRKYWWNYNNVGPYSYTSGETVDQISTFSSRGPRVDSGAPNKPSIVAPGSAIISVRDTNIYTWPSSYNSTVIDNDGPNADNTTRNDGSGPADYYVMHGTSMACPIAAGVAALILEKYPSATPAQIKQAMESTATDEGAGGFDTTYGYGLIDALAALGYDLAPPTMETIAEAQGLYYNTAPVLSNFGFDDEIALDDGWYQMDSYSGSWVSLFTDDPDTSWDNDSWPIPEFDGLSEGSHTIYFKASDDTANVEGESGEWSWQFYKDTVAPTDPTGVNSTSHTASDWSSDNTVDITWTDGTDSLSGLDGYSVLWNTDNSTIPDAVKDIEEGSGNTTSAALVDGSSHYFHIRSVDNAGNWQSTIHLGPFYIETVPPTDPTSVNSTSHTTSVWSSDSTVDITWTDATDNLSGLDGYSILWDTSANTTPGANKTIEQGVQAATSSALADGNSHYLHIRSVDNAGNWQSTAHLGPFYIDTTSPSDPTSINSTSHTVSDWSSDNTVDIAWTDAIDTLSGLDGYSILWDTSANTTPNSTKNIEDGIGNVTSSELADGNSHYLHIRSVDNIGNWQSTAHLGPFYIAVNAPFLSNGTVSPSSGYASTNFTFSANYTDFEDDAPVSITITTDNTTTANMTEQDSLDVDFTDGKIYEYSVLGSSLGLGSHTFQFAASDGTDSAIGDTGSNSGPTVSSPPSNGGGDGGGGVGGGGGGATDDTRITGFGDTIRESGEIWEDVVVPSLDNKLNLDIPAGTFAKNRADATLYSIQVKTLAESPEVPQSMEAVGLVYELLPDGAKFDPPIPLTIVYDISEIPEGVSESNLFIAKWIESSQEWIELESTVDPATQTVTTTIDGFSIHTIMARFQPASFSLTDLTINPESVVLGGDISVSVLLENSGDLTGSYEVNLKINDVQAQSQEITLSGGDSERVNFSVSPEAVGTYTVNIGDLTGQCEVIAPAAPPTPAAIQALPPTPAPASFAISDLSVTPGKVRPAEQVTISALVANTGGGEGSYTVILNINGAEEARQEVTLGVDRSELATFTVARDAEGSYTVDIDGETGQFTVIIPPLPMPAPTEALPVTPPTNWGLIGGIIAGILVVVAGLLVYFLVWRKRSAPRPS